MDVTLADMRVKAATSSALDRGTRLCSSFCVLSDTLYIKVFVDNYYSSLIECDIFRSVVENAPVVVGNGISEIIWTVA